MWQHLTVLLAAFCITAISSTLWPGIPQSREMVLVAIATVIIFCLFIYRRKHRFVLKIGKFRFPFFTSVHQPGRSITGCYCFSGILIGILWVASLGHWHFAWQPLEDKIQQDVIVTGRIAECHSFVDYQLIIINGESIDNTSFSGGIAVRVDNSFGQFTIHQRLQLTLVLKPASSFINPGYDRRASLVAKNTPLSGYVPAHGFVKILAPANSLHHVTSRKLLNADYSRWMLALFTGNRSNLSKEDWTLLQRTGTAHLFSISGLHVAMVALWTALITAPMIAFLFWLVTVNYNRLNLSTGIASSVLISTTLYASIANWQIPVFRAWLCIGVLYFFALLGKYWLWHQRFLVILTLCIVIFPRSVYSSSLYLSAGAVMMILLIQWRYPLRSSSLWFRIITMLRLQCLLSLLLIPITLLFFEQASWLTSAINLLAIPWISVLVPIGLAGLVLAHWGEHNNLLLDLTEYGLNTLIKWLESCDQFMLVTSLPALSSTSIICTLLILFCWLCPAFPYRSLCTLILVIPIFSHFLPPSDGRWVVHVFDVGQGTATVVSRGGRGVVIDTGPSYPTGNAFEQVVLPSLKKLGVNYIDRLIVTHGDDDHAGGAQSVMAQIDRGRRKESYITNTQGCVKGSALHWQGLQFEFLWPAEGGEVKDTNHYSCVVRITDGTRSVLFAGDIDTTAEYALLYSHTVLQSNVLIVPHHGSRTSSSPAFIDAVSPDYAVFTTGYLHRWGLPHKNVKLRYTQRGIRTMRSSLHGYMQFNFLPFHLKVSNYGTQAKRRWYDARLFTNRNNTDRT